MERSAGGDVSLEREISERIRARLRKLIRTRFGSTHRLAKQIGADPSTLSKVLSRDRGVGIALLFRLHHGLGRSSDEFLDDDVEAKYYVVGSEWPPGVPRRGRRPDVDPPASAETEPPSSVPSPSGQPGGLRVDDVAEPRTGRRVAGKRT